MPMNNPTHFDIYSLVVNRCTHLQEMRTKMPSVHAVPRHIQDIPVDRIIRCTAVEFIYSHVEWQFRYINMGCGLSHSRTIWYEHRARLVFAFGIAMDFRHVLRIHQNTSVNILLELMHVHWGDVPPFRALDTNARRTHHRFARPEDRE